MNKVIQHHNNIMNIFIQNIFDVNILRGYGGTLLVLLSALGNVQIVFAVMGGVLGVLISIIAFLKSLKEYRKADFEERAARITFFKLKKSVTHGKGSSSETEESNG